MIPDFTRLFCSDPQRRHRRHHYTHDNGRPLRNTYAFTHDTIHRWSSSSVCRLFYAKETQVQEGELQLIGHGARQTQQKAKEKTRIIVILFVLQIQRHNSDKKTRQELYLFPSFPSLSDWAGMKWVFPPAASSESHLIMKYTRRAVVCLHSFPLDRGHTISTVTHWMDAPSSSQRRVINGETRKKGGTSFLISCTSSKVRAKKKK